MKKCIFLYRQRYLSYLVLLLLLWPTVMLAAQGDIQIKGKFSQGGYPVYRRNE